MRVPSPAELAAKVETKTLPATPAPKVYPSGRIGWPDVVQYDLVDLARQPIGARLDLPPEHDKPFVVVVHDLPAYELLVATNALQDERHTGAAARVPWANQHDKPVTT